MTRATSDAGLVQIGTIDPSGAATPLYVDAGMIPFTALPVTVQLTKSFAQSSPPGWPAPPHQTGVAPGGGHFPKTHATGLRITVFANVAAALIAAGAAVKI